jgi:predicted AlkP superfamily pyrophosphatase or phosphodiesterase
LWSIKCGKNIFIRYESKFGANGFNRFVKQGFMLKNAHYNYVPTETGPGHASIYTGTTPAIHGIVANDWYDRTLKKDVNCVGDDQQKPVGTRAWRKSFSGKITQHNNYR